MKIKSIPDFIKGLKQAPNMNFSVSYQTEPGMYSYLNREELIEVLEAQQHKISILAITLADKLEKGELK